MSRALALANLGIPAFDPHSYAGFMLWLRGGNLTLSGSNVSAWPDESGAGNLAQQGTGADQPTVGVLGGQPGVQGNGTTQFLATSTLSAVPALVFVVAQAVTQTSTFACAIASVDQAHHLLYNPTATQMEYYSGGTGITQTCNSTLPHVYAAVINGASSTFYVDGVGMAGTLGAESTSALEILADGGATFYWPGVVAEIMMWSSLPAAGQVSAIGRSLASKYAISGSW